MYRHPLYPNLFSPLKINRLVLKNRIFYAPVENYQDRALSGCAVMMRGTSGTVRDHRCRLSPGKWLFLPSEMKRVKEELTVLKRAGALTSLEVMHAGIGAWVPEGDYVIGPSDGVRNDGVIIKGMDQEMMQQMIDEFVETCVIAKKIGYDMVMIHFAHGWIASQFFSPKYNQRTDEFGGCYENRVRFPKMILRAVRKALGKDYTIDMRISAYEDFEGAMSQEETIQFIKEVAEEGLIDVVNVSYGGHLADSINYSPSAFAPDMCYADYAKPIKEAVNIPVVVVGKIMTPEQAESIIAEGKADAVVIGRASIADPYWAKKAFECRPDDIIPCIACGKCFDKRCSVQLRSYLEYLVPLKLEKAEKSEKVVVIGGGPAGMKAAITATQRGHDVTLYEAESQLGGLTKAADYDENKRELRRYKNYMIRQLYKSGAKVVLNNKVTPEMVKAMNPDRLILAMGSTPVTPPIKGVENAMQAMEAHEKVDTLGKKIVMIGGGLTGSEFAITLTRRGHEVSIIEKTNIIGGKGDDTTFRPYDMMVRMGNIALYPETECTEIGKDYVVIKNAEGSKNLAADTVILSTGFRSNSDGLEEFFGITPNTVVIGDLRRPATIRECEEEGYFAVAEN